MVLDGLPHPSKAASHKRRTECESTLLLLNAALKDPNFSKKDIFKNISKCLILSRSDIHAYCIEQLKKLDIKFVVAPFEADWHITAGVISHLGQKFSSVVD